MTPAGIKIEALLRTTTSHLLQAAEAVNRYRLCWLDGDIFGARQSSIEVCRHMEIVRVAIAEVTASARQGADAPRLPAGQEGGLVN